MKYETQLFGGQTNLHCMKQILHNAKSNSHGCIRLAICIATAFAVVMLTACSDGNGTMQKENLIRLMICLLFL